MLHSHVRSCLLATQLMALVFVFGSGSEAAGAADADISHIQAAAERGHVRDEIALADAYFTGQGVQKDLKQAAFWYEKAAGSGDPVAQNQIGYLYQIGLGVPPDEVRAVHWYQLAASSGFLDAKVNLGVAYLWGAGVPRNPELAVRYIREAADKGSAIGATYLGDMYNFGVGLSKDVATAEQWYERGAKLHNSLAAFRLGRILFEQKDHPQNIKRTVTLYREAASAGFVPAMHALGLLLVNHPELNTSHDSEALSLLNRAADAGTWRSSVVLGILSRDGRMLPQDDKAAYFHFQVAIQQGGDTARDLLNKELQLLSSKLDTGQRGKIDEEVHAWIQQHAAGMEIMYTNENHMSRFLSFGVMPSTLNVHGSALIPANAF